LSGKMDLENGSHLKKNKDEGRVYTGEFEAGAAFRYPLTEEGSTKEGKLRCLPEGGSN